MKNLIIAFLKYFYTENKEIYIVNSIKQEEAYAGIQIVISTYYFYKLFSVSVSKRIFWKPFKKVISDEALPSLLENNKKGKDPYVNVWFELEKELVRFDLYTVKINSKIKLNSSLNYYLVNVLKTHKNDQNE